jgi:3-isopropylmalate/(R)-2-methylmalate dehydratase large subunit
MANPELSLFFLSSDSHINEAQVNGEPIPLNTAIVDINLATNISTDSIYPTKKVEKNGHSQVALSGIDGIKVGDIARLSPSTLIVGPGFGSGSSREHAPISLSEAGIRTIICISPDKTGKLERIFEENAAIACGIDILYIHNEPKTVEDLVSFIEREEYERPYLDKLRPDIIRSGGLTQYNIQRLRAEVEPYQISHENQPQTAVEIIASRHMVNLRPNSAGQRIALTGDLGFLETSYSMSYALHSPIIAETLDLFRSHFPDLIFPDSIHLFQDHCALVHDDPRFQAFIDTQVELAQQYGLRIEDSQDGITDGICHSLAIERAYIKPGSVAIGTDSHTCTLGVLNSLAWGAGATAVANSWVTKESLVQVPDSVRIEFTGELNEEVTPKDVIQFIIGQDFVLNGSSTGTVFEFCGQGLNTWSIEAMAVLTNMAVEGRAMSGIVTQLTPAHLKYYNEHFAYSEEQTRQQFVTSNPDATYKHKLTIDLSLIEPMIALPSDPRNVIALSELDSPVPVTHIYSGSCTSGGIESIRQIAKILRNKRVKDNINLFVQCATLNIFEQAKKDGLIGDIQKAGAIIVPPACGACIGLGIGKTPDKGNCLSTTNRNFPGRMGGEAPVYLVSPITAAKTALTGYLQSDSNR